MHGTGSFNPGYHKPHWDLAQAISLVWYDALTRFNCDSHLLTKGREVNGATLRIGQFFHGPVLSSASTTPLLPIQQAFAGQDVLQIRAGVGGFRLGDGFGGADRDDVAAFVAAFGAHVDDPVGGLDDVEIVLDNKHGVAGVGQALQERDQLLDVGEVQAGGGLVEDIQRLAGRALAELAGELDSLRFAAGELRGRLSEADVVEAHLVDGLQFARDCGQSLEELHRLTDRHLQDVGDILALVAHLQRFAVVALASAYLARDKHIGKEVHLDLDDPLPFTCFAPSALDVERETPGLIPAHASIRGLTEQLANHVERAGVGRRVRARGPSDRTLVDVDDFVD